MNLSKCLFVQIQTICDQMQQPKVISHRGRSDIFPENTLEALNQALLTSDYAEFDVMLTKDLHPIVFHDRYLSEITNIAEFHQFQNRKTVHDDNQFGQLPTEDWWVKDFTLEELKKLNVIQKHKSRPQITDRPFRIPTLDQLLKNCLDLKQKVSHQNKSGLLIEIKTERENFKMSERDHILLAKIYECLKRNHLQTSQKCQQANLPIIVQAFNQEALQQWYRVCPDLSIVHLYYDQDQNVGEKYLQDQRTSKSIGAAISKAHMTQQFVELCQRLKYQVYFWSVRDDNPEIPFGVKDYNECYKTLKAMNVGGIITDFAQNCKHALQRV